MTRQRLADAATGGAGGGNGPMRPGDTKILTARDPKTGEVIKTYTLIRTDRSYAEDLRDAYNAGRTTAAHEFYLDGQGTVRIGTPHEVMMARLKADKIKAEQERRAWIANHRDDYAEAAE